MMKKETAKRTSMTIILAMIMLLTTMQVGYAAQRADAESAEKVTAGFSYNSDDFTVTEDYAKYVDTGMYYSGTIADTVSAEYIILDPAERQMKTRLDEGKSGVWFSSVETGKDVEGKSVAIKNKLTGDFSIDFRVFSQENYQGAGSIGSVWAPLEEGGANVHKGSLYKDEFNPYLDIRTVGIKITSATDATKSFTTYIHGATDWNPTATNARVYIDGEEYRNQGKKGYGLDSGTAQPDNSYYSTTTLRNTSFSNVSGDKENFSNVIKFDIDKMAVYGISYGFDFLGGQDGYKYTENQLLIRNIGTNNLTDDNTGGTWSGSGLKTLSATDFKNGYYAEIFIDSMTGNDVPLSKAVKVTEDLEEGTGIYDSKTDINVIPDSEYDRRANLIVYNVNGQDLRKYEGFDVSAGGAVTLPTDGSEIHSGIANVSALRLTSKAKNTEAEGNSFTLDSADFMDGNVFAMMVDVKSTKYNPSSALENPNPWGGIGAYNYNGLGSKYDGIDPYSDVREVGVTFRSKVNPSKAFTVYLSSRSRVRQAVSVRVGVEGEAYRNLDGQKGYGYDNNAWSHKGVTPDTGSMGLYSYGGGNFRDTSAAIANKSWMPFKFDVDTMTVYSTNYGAKVVRPLSVTDGVAANAKSSIRTLDKADFEGGFNVTLSVAIMNRKDNLGVQTYTHYMDGKVGTVSNYTAVPGTNRVLSEGYDRPAIIDVYKMKSNTSVTAAEVEYSTEASRYNVKNHLLLNKTSVAYGGETLSPSINNLFDGVTACSGSIAYAHATQSDSGTVALDDGSGTFNPKFTGIYNFTYNNSATGSLTVVDNIPPEITLVGSSSVIVTHGAVGDDPGATVSDNYDGDISANIVSTWSSLGSKKAGTYTVTYNVSDSSGNAATEVTRTVIIEDKTAPVISFEDGKIYTVAYRNVGSAPAATALDANDGDLTGSIASDWANVITNEKALGTYTVTYTVTDGAGNTATDTISVTIADKTVPEITLTGKSPLFVEFGKVGADPGATALDDIDGDSLTVNSDWSTVITDATAIGEYTVTYTVTDAAGNTATEERIVKIVVNTDPVVILIGSGNMTVTLGAAGSDPGAMASDADDGDLTSSVTSDWATVVTGATAAGTVTVTYSVTDSFGKTATATRTVKIEYSTPVISAVTYDSAKTGADIDLKTPTITDSIDGTVTAFTVKVEDSEGNDVTVDVYNSTTKKFNFSSAGTYKIIYSATNSTNQSATTSATIKIEKTASGCGGAMSPTANILFAAIIFTLLFAGMFISRKGKKTNKK